MSKKTRYFLIFLCFLFFAIASPIIVLYVKGIAYDFQKNTFYKTGTLGVKSNPKKVNIVLDGKIIKTSEGNLRFLKPKEYLVEISKDGYQTWSKHLTISEGLVTWANPGNSKVNLFYTQPKTLFSTNSVSSLFSIDDKIFYTKEGVLVEQSLIEVAEKFPRPLPKNYEKALIAYKIESSNAFMLKTIGQETADLLYDVENKLFVSLKNILGVDAKIKYYANGIAYSLEENKLFEIDPKKNTKTLISDNIAECLFTEQNFYFLKKDLGSLSLFASDGPKNPGSKIISGIPLAKKLKIFIDFQKHIFVLSDTDLFQISSKPELIADNIIEINFNNKHNGFAYITGPEFYWLDSSNPYPKFIHRSSYSLKLPTFVPEINSAFINKNNQLYALELDLRDKQNEFLLFPALNISAYAISGDGKSIALLDSENLSIFEIK